MNTQANVTVGQERKLLSIGAAWINRRDEADISKPALTIKLDQNLGVNITLAPQGQILLFRNKNFRADSQDPEFRVAVSIPAEIADAEIARQQALRAASAAPAPVVTPAMPAMPTAQAPILA